MNGHYEKVGRTYGQPLVLESADVHDVHGLNDQSSILQHIQIL